MKMMARLVAKEEEEESAEKNAEQQDEIQHIGEKDAKAPAELRVPSPSRTRRAQPESPKKTSTPLKASAFEFVPPGFSSLAKTTSTLQASAEPASLRKASTLLNASAFEFVPPDFCAPSGCLDEQTDLTQPMA